MGGRDTAFSFEYKEETHLELKLYKVSGWEEAIMSLRMSKGKYYSWDKAQEIQDLVYVITDKQGFIATQSQYHANLNSVGFGVGYNNPKITGYYDKDVEEFKRLLGLTMDNAMGHHNHHTLMKYVDISFFTEGLHRGAQDDLDAHAIAFNNRITRFSTRLATIDDVSVSEWYKDKVIPFHDINIQLSDICEGEILPQFIWVKDGQLQFTNDVGEVPDGDSFRYTPFGYVLRKYADMNHEASIRKDVVRGLMPLGMPSNALWKTDMFNLRYIYKMRGQLTKANPELKIGIEQLADQIEENVPVFGEYFRKVYTDSGVWENVHKVKTLSMDEWKEYQNYKMNKDN